MTTSSACSRWSMGARASDMSRRPTCLLTNASSASGSVPCRCHGLRIEGCGCGSRARGMKVKCRVCWWVVLVLLRPAVVDARVGEAVPRSPPPARRCWPAASAASASQGPTRCHRRLGKDETSGKGHARERGLALCAKVAASGRCAGQGGRVAPVSVARTAREACAGKSGTGMPDISLECDGRCNPKSMKLGIVSILSFGIA